MRTGPHGAALEGRPGERRASDASYLYDFRQPQATLQQAEGGSFKQSENRLDVIRNKYTNSAAATYTTSGSRGPPWSRRKVRRKGLY